MATLPTTRLSASRLALGLTAPTAATALLWSAASPAQAAPNNDRADKQFRTDVLEPARAELVGYLQKECGAKLSKCIAADTPYRDNPYGGATLPGGSKQIVTNQASALKVYTERLGYGFAATSSTRQSPSVPKGAESLLVSTYPLLTDAQRRSVLAQTEARSGHPLDTTWTSRHGTAPGSWQRLNLAKAMSATVKVFANGRVKVVSTGGLPKLIILSR